MTATLEAPPQSNECVPTLDVCQPNTFVKHTKRYSKCVEKMGLVAYDGCIKACFRKKGSLAFIVTRPEIFRYPQKDVYFVFGEAHLDHDYINNRDRAARYVTGMDMKDVFNELNDPRAIRAPRYYEANSPLLMPDTSPKSSAKMSPQSCGVSHLSELSQSQSPDSAMKHSGQSKNNSQTSVSPLRGKNQQSAKKGPRMNGKLRHQNSNTPKRASNKQVKSSKKKETKNGATQGVKESPNGRLTGKKSEKIGNDNKTVNNNTSIQKTPSKGRNNSAKLHEEYGFGAGENNHEDQKCEGFTNNAYGGEGSAYKEHDGTYNTIANAGGKSAGKNERAKENTCDGDVHKKVPKGPHMEGALQKGGQKNPSREHSSAANKPSNTGTKMSIKDKKKGSTSSSGAAKNNKKASHARDAKGKGNNVALTGGTVVLRCVNGPSGKTFVREERQCFDDGEGDENEDECEFSELQISVVMSHGGVTRGTAIRALKRNKGDLLGSVLELTLGVEY